MTKITSSCQSSVLCDITDSENANSDDFETYIKVLWLAWEDLSDHLTEFILGPPVACIVTRAAVEVPFFKIEVGFLADSAELWMFRVELLITCSKAISMPASDDHFATWSSAKHHLFDAFFPDEVGKDAESVHAHAGKSGRSWSPKFIVGRVTVFGKNLVEFHSVAELKFDFRVLQLLEVIVDLEGEVDHLLADLDSHEHVVVIGHLGE